jgi:hypothetical protein
MRRPFRLRISSQLMRLHEWKALCGLRYDLLLKSAVKIGP